MTRYGIATCPECEGKSTMLTDEDADQDESCPHCGYRENTRYGPGNPDWDRDRLREIEEGA